MTVSKETMKKVKRLEKLEEEAQRIRDELRAEFHDYMDGVCINDFHIFDEPGGDEQGEGEYCSQATYAYCSDSGYGTYYYPIKNSKKYLGISYDF